MFILKGDPNMSSLLRGNSFRLSLRNNNTNSNNNDSNDNIDYITNDNEGKPTSIPLYWETP